MKQERERVVLDTNTIISGVIRPLSVSAEALRKAFLELYRAKAILCEVSEIVTDCRDAKDNKFLSLALSAEAKVLVTGDGRDLLKMHPYRGVAIVCARDFLA